MRKSPEKAKVLAFLASPLWIGAAMFAFSDAFAADCGRRQDAVEMLKRDYGPRPSFMAMTSDGRVLELWERPSGAWSLVITSPEGFACIYATGDEAWEPLPKGRPA